MAQYTSASKLAFKCYENGYQHGNGEAATASIITMRGLTEQAQA